MSQGCKSSIYPVTSRNRVVNTTSRSCYNLKKQVERAAAVSAEAHRVHQQLASRHATIVRNPAEAMTRQIIEGPAPRRFTFLSLY